MGKPGLGWPGLGLGWPGLGCVWAGLGLSEQSVCTTVRGSLVSLHDSASPNVGVVNPNGQVARQLERKSEVCTTVQVKTTVLLLKTENGGTMIENRWIQVVEGK